jgi:uncharacterized protein (DUF58 family)
MPSRFHRIEVFQFNRSSGTDPESKVTLHFRQWLLLAAFILALVWYVLGPSRVSAAATAGLAGILIFSYVWARSMALQVSGRRKLLFTALQVGDELEEIISLQNHSHLPVLWAEFSDHSNIPGYNVSSVRAADANATVEWRAHTTCTRRGIYTLGPWELHTSDPLGVFDVQQVYFQTEEILVYPPMAALPASLLPHRSSLGDQRPLYQPLAAETINVVTTRPYLPGDPLRRIHWRTTARRGSIYVRIFEPEASSNIWLIADLDAAVELGSDMETTTEKMVVLLASLSAQLLQQRLAVGLFALSSKPHVVMPQRGPAHLWNILRALAPLHTTPDQPFEVTLQRAASLISSHDLLVAVTPSLNPAWSRHLRELVQTRGAHGAEAILLDPASFIDKGDPRYSEANSLCAEGSAAAFVPYLAGLGIAGRVVRNEDIRPILGTYGELRRWEFVTLGTGRVLARKTPRTAGIRIAGL